MKAQIEIAVTLAREQEFTRWIVQGAVLEGWLLAQQGKTQEAIPLMRQGTTVVREQSPFAAPLAEAYGRVGEAEEGLRVIHGELARVLKIGERFYEAELYRVHGELLLRRAVADEEQAETCFEKAISVGRAQSAKSLELRAAMSLSKLWQRQGKKADAQKLLAEVYGWFTEGFDTADLKQAKLLLEELSSRR